MSEGPQRATALEPWLMCLLVEEDTACSLHHETRALQLPSGRTAYVTLCAFPLLDAHQQAVGSVSVFREITHRYSESTPSPTRPSGSVHPERSHRAHS
jgi:hypothetical protein